ncbi:nicotinate phosphoribosyltransferase, partial [Georgenia sp. 10Sc9-8]|nr:nicotinate phosphoribosyltransferase [Georgenia halotolerans]
GRVLDGDGRAAEELVVSGNDLGRAEQHLRRAGARPLVLPLVRGGEVLGEHCGTDALAAAAHRHRRSREELPYDAWRLSEGDPALPTRHVDLDADDDPRP